MFSCQEDAGLDYIENGGTVNGNFTIVVPANKVVEATRGEAEESNINEIYLLYFDTDNNYSVSSEKLALTNPVVGEYTRTYNVKTTTKFVPGHNYEIYAIANPNSSLGDIESVESIDYATFRELLISLNTLNTSFNTLTMSGMTTSRAAGADYLTGKISVRRPFAKVEFKIRNADASKFEFTPTSYSVKNVPIASRLFGAEDGVAQMKRTADDYANYNKLSDFTVEAGVNKIQFFQLENAAGTSDNVANYNDRELRNDATAEGGDHSAFAHGCDFATYIEIEGTGVGYNANGEPATQATLKYTIHLGDFDNNPKDFNVLRNHWYDYTVTIKGINNIKVEAESGEFDEDNFQHGAEGTIIDMQSSKMIYNLDAHYEQARLKLDVTNLIGQDEVGKEIVGITLSVSTPMMADANKNAVVDWATIQAAAADPSEFDQMYDTKWIEFYTNNSISSSFAKYPGASATMTPVVFLSEIYKALKGQTSKVTITEEDDKKYVWAMAYINEYFYDINPLNNNAVEWSEFVNQDDRTMKILQAPEVSADKHSIYTGALCAFTQRSIRTIFDYDAVGENNAYGIEWYDETGAMANFGSVTQTGSEKDNGYANFGKWVTSSWTTYLNNSGYDYEGQATGDARNEYNALKTQNAAYACLQRNRDLDNDNTIDATERRWYPAAINQYLAFWYGINALPNEAKFIKGDPANYATTPAEYGKLDHYFTSTYGGSYGSNNVYWAIEGFATSPDQTAYGHSGNHHIRCLRNLNSITEAPMEVVSSDVLEGFEENYVVIPNGLTASAYRGIATERLPIHHERDAANNLSKAFMVATADLESAYEAYSEEFAAPEIFTVSANNDMVYFVGNDTYTYSTNANGASSSTVLKLNAQNGAAIALNTANTYYFWTKRIYNTYSGATTLKYENGAWVATTGTNGTLTVSGSSTSSSNTSFTAMAATQQDLCANYSEETDYDGQPAWRVPNQKELAAMRSLELIDGPTSRGVAYHSSTMYSLRNLVSSSGTDERFSFQWYYNKNQGGESFGLQGMSNYPGPIRCVRDLTNEEFESLIGEGDIEL